MRAHGTQAARQAGEQSSVGRPGGPGGVAGRMLALQRLAGNAAVTQAVQRATHEHGPGCGHGEPEADVQRRMAPSEPAFEEPRVSVNDAISTSGKPLPSHIQDRAEQAYGMSFGHVRLHDNAVAQQSAVQLKALAYTTGNHIVAQRSSLDDATMFHEAHHVWQQSQGKVAGTDNGHGESVSSPDHSEEVEAAEVGARMARGDF
ncbi:eCIS core domain-containing protein [Streptomyces sp. JW3]|uniref:eCIS core domain-containing protein n=1 Tax=Streptomyces sp. JW3 TaxID=3456955 RepID=UPI003FA49355